MTVTTSRDSRSMICRKASWISSSNHVFATTGSAISHWAVSTLADIRAFSHPGRPATSTSGTRSCKASVGSDSSVMYVRSSILTRYFGRSCALRCSRNPEMSM